MKMNLKFSARRDGFTRAQTFFRVINLAKVGRDDFEQGEQKALMKIKEAVQLWAEEYK